MNLEFYLSYANVKTISFYLYVTRTPPELKYALCSPLRIIDGAHENQAGVKTGMTISKLTQN